MRYLLNVLLVCSLSLAFFSPLQAQTTVVVSNPQRQSPIALPQLCLRGENAHAAREIPRVMAKDLDLSGYFEVLNPAAYLDDNNTGCTSGDVAKYDDWATIRAEWLVKGVIESQGQQVRLKLFLHDVPSRKAVVGKEYSGTVADIANIAHKFANEVMKFVTGKEGPFGSRIVFSSRIGRFKDLFVMDMDGSNVRQLTKERGLALSPAWDKAGEKILFTSYRQRIPDLFMLDLAKGTTTQITKGPALEVGGTFTPPGTSILTSITESNDSSLVEIDFSGRKRRTLTPRNGAIDVSPDISPDGRYVAFCSDRAGGPQIYVMESGGGPATRVSFVSSRYCTSPAWSPDGDRIAFVCRADGGFQLFLANPDGSSPLQLTSGGDNEDPTWSPDGRYVAFASTFGKKAGFNLALMRVARNLEGSNFRQISFTRGDDSQPDWGPLPW
jgi:TolB protein